MFYGNARGWIGIDLGTSAIKLAQVERVDRRWRLAYARVIRRDPSLAGGSVEETLTWWERVCREEDLREGFVGRRAACVLPAAVTDLRAMNVPEGSEPERRAMIVNELEVLFSAQPGRRAFDFWDSRPPVAEGASNLENVNVLSVLEDEASAVVAGLARAGLRCEVLDGLSTTLSRALGLFSKADPAHPWAAIDWGSTSATFSVLTDGRPVFTRHLRDCGFAALPAAVSEAMNLSTDDAEQLLASYGVSDPRAPDAKLRDVQEILTDVVSGSVSRMVGEINKTLAYPELHRSRLVPERIWLFGGGATVRNLAPLLSSRINLPVETWNLSGASSGEPAVSSAPVELLGPAAALSALAWEA